jgi:hypothetical protein
MKIDLKEERVEVKISFRFHLIEILFVCYLNNLMIKMTILMTLISIRLFT